MRTIVIILLVLLAFPLAAFGGDASSSEPGVALLKDYRFEDGGYAIVGRILLPHALQKELGDFYTDDVDVMNQMKAGWVTGGPSPVFACGYHYNIYVMQAGAVLESFAVNLNEGCNTVVSAKGYYYFDPQNLAAFAGRLKKARRETKTFSSLEEGREFLPSLAHTKGLLMYFKPDWAEYDGELSIVIPCETTEVDSPLFDTCRNDFEAGKRTAYPDEPFTMVESSRSSSGTMSLTVKCRKTLYEKFREAGSTGQWKDYSPSMTLFWKAATPEAVPPGDEALDECDQAVYYTCDTERDKLRVYDRDLCEQIGKNRARLQSIKVRQEGKLVAASASCKLKNRSYLIEVSSCRAGSQSVPLITISSEGRIAFKGSYGAECPGAEALIYFHYATSDEVEIGKRMLLWNER